MRHSAHGKCSVWPSMRRFLVAIVQFRDVIIQAEIKSSLSCFWGDNMRRYLGWALASAVFFGFIGLNGALAADMAVKARPPAAVVVQYMTGRVSILAARLVASGIPPTVTSTMHR